jgi:hypothetical protein
MSDGRQMKVVTHKLTSMDALHFGDALKSYCKDRRRGPLFESKDKLNRIAADVPGSWKNQNDDTVMVLIIERDKDFD